MQIKEITWQHRRDFEAIFVCQNCGHEEKGSGYDDRLYHDNVIPKMKCGKCGESTESKGLPYRPLMTKYPEGFQI